MTSEEMFDGFSVAAGDDRFGEHVKLGGEPNDCKVSAQDTAGALAIFEFAGAGGGPRHLHYDQEEWIYVLDGEIELVIGEKQLRLGAGESVFIPRKVPRVWGCVNGKPSKIIDVYQPRQDGGVLPNRRKSSRHPHPRAGDQPNLDRGTDCHAAPVVRSPRNGSAWPAAPGRVGEGQTEPCSVRHHCDWRQSPLATLRDQRRTDASDGPEAFHNRRNGSAHASAVIR